MAKYDRLTYSQDIVNLNIRPSLDIAAQFSNNRNVVFEMLNYDLVVKFE